MSDALRFMLAHPPGAMTFQVSELVPLHRHYAPTGAVMADVACVRLDGRLYFHPQRIAELKAWVANPQPAAGELARWDDDGGALR